jgi:adenosylcobinamide kinase / adenosylcobinamide-phosphate guanylyltransferase
VRTLALGGLRSGKSQWAEAAIAESLTPDQSVRYLATGPTMPDDADWSHRIAEHRSRRPAHWWTVETDDLTTHLRQSPQIPTLVDDVGGWLTATLDRRGAWDDDGSVSADVDELLNAVTAFRAPLMLVSPEVGLTVVPATAPGRRFTDELGMLNQRLADLCERVVLVVAGQAVPIKPGRP